MMERITGPHWNLLSLSLSPSSASESIASPRFFPPLTLQLALIFTGIPSHLFSCLAALAQAKDRPFQYLGTALRVLKEIFVASTWPLFTKSLMECSATRPSYNHCSLVASLSTPPDFHLPFFNLHALKFLGVMYRTTLSKPRLTWPTGANYNPSPSLWNIRPFTDYS